MGIIPKKGRVVEEVIPIAGLDPITCREKLKGDVDEKGTCLVRVRLDPGDPNRASLERLIYSGRPREIVEKTG